MPDIDNLTTIAHAYVPRLLSTVDWISVRPYVMELTDSHLLGWVSLRETLRNDVLALTWTATLQQRSSAEHSPTTVFWPPTSLSTR